MLVIKEPGIGKTARSYSRESNRRVGAHGVLAYDYLLREAQSLQIRLSQQKPFIMTMPMVKGAQISRAALGKITHLLQSSKVQLNQGIHLFLIKLNDAKSQNSHPGKIQKEFIMLKLRFNNILDQLDIFSDVLSQRSEHDVGIWLSGLDTLAEDALRVGVSYYDEAPELMVFLERGHGAAIRRARTRLPGGDENPVGIIQIPRERLVGNGIAASIIHEVGHQGAELLGITHSLRLRLQEMMEKDKPRSHLWRYYERWISEIIADYWAICHLGICATTGLMGVVTLPKYFQFRLELDDPHPAPYMRVAISCAFGELLFPSAAWKNIWDLWQQFYTLGDLPKEKVILIEALLELRTDFINLVHFHKVKSLKGKTVGSIFPIQERQPEKLGQIFQHWEKHPFLMKKAPPTLVFAVLGQAKFNGEVSPIKESKMLTQQLRNWAYQRQ